MLCNHHLNESKKKKNLIDIFYYIHVKTDLFLIYVVLNIVIVILIMFAL